MKKPTTKEEIDSFLLKIQDDVNELDARRTRVRDAATIMQQAQTDEHYLNFKAEFDSIIVLLRRLCFGCVDFNPDKKERAEKFLFEAKEGYTVRNALVLMDARDLWDALVAALARPVEGGKPLISFFRRFANGYVCHGDPNVDETFDALYGEVVHSNGLYTRIEEVSIRVVSAFETSLARYQHQDVCSDKKTKLISM